MGEGVASRERIVSPAGCVVYTISRWFWGSAPASAEALAKSARTNNDANRIIICRESGCGFGPIPSRQEC